MYTLLSEKLLKSRKQHRCIWCPERIEVGAKYVREASVYDGDFQNHAWHPECRNAALKFFKENPDETEFEPGGNPRPGSLQPGCDTAPQG